MIFGGITFGGKLGGWNITNYSAKNLPQPLASATSDLMTGELTGFGANYMPIWYMANQLVNGTNHLLICKQTRTTREPVKKIVAVNLNIPPSGAITGKGVTIREIIEDTDLVEGVGPDVNLLQKFEIAATKNGRVGCSFKPILYVGSQVVKGINYFIVAEANINRPGVDPYAVLIKMNVFQDNPEFVEIVHLQ